MFLAREIYCMEFLHDLTARSEGLDVWNALGGLDIIRLHADGKVTTLLLSQGTSEWIVCAFQISLCEKQRKIQKEFSTFKNLLLSI
jgi:hypothetical protein